MNTNVSFELSLGPIREQVCVSPTSNEYSFPHFNYISLTDGQITFLQYHRSVIQLANSNTCC